MQAYINILNKYIKKDKKQLTINKIDLERLEVKIAMTKIMQYVKNGDITQKELNKQLGK